MSRDLNYNTLRGSVDDIEDILLEDEVIIPKVQKIKKKKRFDDGTPIKVIHRKFANENREESEKK